MRLGEFQLRLRQGSSGMKLSPDQKTVHEWLDSKLEMPVFADGYLAALSLMSAKRPGYIPLVAHIGRDFMNILPTAVRGISTSQVQYFDLVKKVKTHWNGGGTGPGFGPSSGPTEGQVISYEASGSIQELIDEHDKGRARSGIRDFLFFSTFLDYDNDETIPDHLLKDWREARNWFLSVAHLRQKSLPGDAPEVVERHFQTLQGGLYSAASSEFDRLKGLYEILEETNS